MTDNQRWLQDYVQLQFRMEKLIIKHTESRFVDYYYGPTEWKTAVENEAETPASELVRAAMALLDSLSAQGFEEHRQTYLSKQVIALETVCRKLNGESFTLEDEVQRCFDIRPTWIPETRFEQAHALYDEALPGKGSIFERLQGLRNRYGLKKEQSDQLVRLMRIAMDEARRRTREMVDLPEGEEVELDTAHDKVFGGENYYLGNYRSRVELNTDLPTNLRWLIDLVCHEGYPGHHTEFALKEQHLYRGRGYLEQSISPIICPQSVISEGIATSAFKMIFTPEEVEQWARVHLYSLAGIEPVDVDTEKLQQASELMSGIDGNARFMLSDGRPEAEVKQYIMKYALIPEEYAQKDIEFLKDPFREAYIFTYFYGRHLMRPWLSGPDRKAVFKRFLTEQICPSDLVQVAEGWEA